MKKSKYLFILLIFIMTYVDTAVLYPQEKDLDKLLELSLEELLDTQVITASKKSQKLSEVPATVHVITFEQIKERGYFTLEEVLSDLPGFQFRNIVGFNSYAFLRGVPNQNNLILVLIDGIQINELNSGGFYGGGQFNFSNVKRIEVVYGPASALYGTNAMSGVINIITNDPKDIRGGNVSLLFGNYNTRNINFKYGNYNQEKETGFSISGMFKQSDKADLRGEKGDNNWTDNMENFEDDLSFDGKLTYKNFGMGIVFQDKQASRATNYKTIGTNYLDSGTKWHIRFLNGHAKYLYNKSAKWYYQSKLYYRNSTVVDNSIAYILSDTGQTGGQVGYYRPNDLFGFENQFNFTPVKKINIIAGIIWEEEKIAEGFSVTYSGSPDMRPPVPEKPAIMTNYLTSIYFQGQYKFVKNTELTVGLRHDNSSFYGIVNTPRIGLVYNNRKFTTKLLYMEAFRAPKPWDYTYGDGNPNLKPEHLKSIELSTVYSFKENLSVNMVLYKNYLEEILTNAGNRWVNGNELNTDGLEAGLNFVKGKIKSYFNYTYNLSEYENGEKVPEIGNNNANIGVLYSFTKKIKLSLRGNYTGKKKNIRIITSTGSDYVDAAFVMHSTLSILDYKNFNFHIIIKNLFDNEYYHTSDRPPDRYRQPQRSIMLKTEYNF